MVYKRVRGWTSGRSLPVLNFVNYPFPTLREFISFARECLWYRCMLMRATQWKRGLEKGLLNKIRYPSCISIVPLNRYQSKPATKLSLVKMFVEHILVLGLTISWQTFSAPLLCNELWFILPIRDKKVKGFRDAFGQFSTLRSLCKPDQLNFQ